MRLAFVVLLLSPWVGVINAFSSTATTDAKAALLEILPSSGFIGNDANQVKDICEACSALEGTSAEQEYGLFGKWKLRFTSASPYGLVGRLGADDALLQLPKFLVNDSPLLATSVSQKVDTSARLVTSVDLAPWPKLDALSAVPVLGSLQKAKIRLELDHSFKLLEGQLKMDVTLEKVNRKLSGAGDDLPAFIPKESNYELPMQLRPKGTFETTYLDSTLRIDRSQGGELLGEEIFVFERVGVSEDDNDEETRAQQEEKKAATVVVADESVGENCELDYEEDGTPVILCDDVDDTTVPSD